MDYCICQMRATLRLLQLYQTYRSRVGEELIFPFSKTKGTWRVVNESDKHNKGPEIRLVENLLRMDFFLSRNL